MLELNTGGDFVNAISGSGQVVKSGDEKLTRSGSNTYTVCTLNSDGPPLVFAKSQPVCSSSVAL